MIPHLVVSTDEPGVLVDEVRVLQKGQKCLNVVDYFLFIMALADGYQDYIRMNVFYVSNCKLSEPNLLSISLTVIPQNLQSGIL